MRRRVFVLILCVLLVEACSKGEGPVAAHDPKAGPGPAATSHASNTFTAPISPTSDIAADDTARPRAKEGSMLAGKPYLSLGIEAETIVYDVYVNGAFVSADFDGKPARETRPINHFLRSGKNELTVMIVPWELDDGKRGFLSSHRIELKLLVQQAGALEAPAQTIGSLVFTGAGSGPEATKESTPSGMLDSTRNFERSSAGDVSWGPVQIRAINDDGAMLVSRQFTLPVPFLDWEFLRSDSVPLPYEWNKEQRAKRTIACSSSTR